MTLILEEIVGDRQAAEGRIENFDAVGGDVNSIDWKPSPPSKPVC